MRTGLWPGGVLFVCLLCGAGCAGLTEQYGLVETPPVVALFQDGDVRAGEQRYGDALRAYRAVIQQYPASAYAEASYLRIAQIYLNRPIPERDWEGWEGADYAAARDTLSALLEVFPNTHYAGEARNWIKLLDLALSEDSRTEIVRDTVMVEIAPVPPVERPDSSVAWERERARLQRSINTITIERNRFRTERDTCRAVTERLRDQNADLETQLRKTRSEMERMRRMLVDLERRSGN